MANTIKLKNSGTSSNTPSSLEYGELAINYADGKLFYKDGGGSISEFANARASVSDAAPSSPSAGDIWFESDTGKTFIYYDDGTSQQWIEVGAASAAANGSDGAVQFASGGTFSSDDANLHWDDTNNRLGVGTNSPTTALDISQVNPTLTINDTDGVAGGSISSLIQFEASNTVAGEVGFGTAAGNMISWAKDGNYYAGTQSADNVFLRTSDLDRVTIDSSGNVGVGTSTPSQKLDVIGDIIMPVGNGIMFDRSGSDSHILYKETAGGSTYGAGDDVILRNPNGARIRLQTNGTNDRVVVDNNGRVGIGTDSPGYKLDVAGDVRISNADPILVLTDTDTGADSRISATSGVGSLIIEADYNNEVADTNLVFKIDGSEKARINSSGRLGIGTTSPTQALEVVGNIASDGLYVVAASQVTVDVSHATYPKIGNYYSSGDNLEVGSYGGIDFVIDSNGNTGEVFVWRSGGTAGAGARLMQLDESGHLGINGYGPDATYSLSADGAIFQNTVMCDSNNNTTPFYVGRYTNTNEAIGISVADRDGYIFMNQDETSGASYIHIDNNGASGSTKRTYFNCNIHVPSVVKTGTSNFQIDHPLPEMSQSHWLIHTGIEGPNADNLYRGEVSLVDGTASVNLDNEARMTEGTFVALNRRVQCFTTNETDWGAVKGIVDGNILTITAQDSASTATVSWMVIGERKDQGIYESDRSDSEGRALVEVEQDDPSIAPRTWEERQAELANQEAE